MKSCFPVEVSIFREGCGSWRWMQLSSRACQRTSGSFEPFRLWRSGATSCHPSRARQHSRQHSLDLLLYHRLNPVVGQELAHVTARYVEQADETSSKLMSLKEEGGQILHDTSIDSPWSCRRSPPHCVKESFVMQTARLTCDPARLGHFSRSRTPSLQVTSLEVEPPPSRSLL